MGTQQKENFLTSVLKGIRDGLPVVSQVRQALKENSKTPAAPRIVFGLGTVFALVLLVAKLLTHSITWAEALQALEALIPAL